MSSTSDISLLRKHQTKIVIGLLVLLALWGIDNYLKVLRYEKIITNRIGIILFPPTPDYYDDIITSGQISIEAVENLKVWFLDFHKNAEELDIIGRTLNYLPKKRGNPMFEAKTTWAISMFLTQISNDMVKKDLEIMELNESQLERFMILHELSSVWRTITKMYLDAYGDKLCDARKQYWILMYKDVMASFQKFEGDPPIPLNVRFH